jgi:hypothetical protein
LSYSLVRQAILDRRSLSAVYAGRRLHFSPHVVGKGSDKAAHVVAFQYAAGALNPLSSGRWRCLRLAGLRRLARNNDGWNSGDGRARQLACVVRVDVSAW